MQQAQRELQAALERWRLEQRNNQRPGAQQP
jgi:hypothetical protein